MVKKKRKKWILALIFCKKLQNKGLKQPISTVFRTDLTFSVLFPTLTPNVVAHVGHYPQYGQKERRASKVPLCRLI